MPLCAQEAVQRVLLRSSAPGLPCTIHLDSGDGISSLEADRLREACQSLIGHLDVGQGDQVQGPDVSQVNLRGVIGTCTRKYRQIFSWEEIKVT